MKKKYSMALTNITSLLYKVHRNTHTILHYNNLCTRLLYQHQLSRAYNCSKNASEKKISKADKLEEEKKSIPTVETLHLMSTDFIKFLIWNKELYTIQHKKKKKKYQRLTN
jgi:hypothetical protein